MQSLLIVLLIPLLAVCGQLFGSDEQAMLAPENAAAGKLLAAVLAQEEQALKQQEQALLQRQAENELRTLQGALFRVQANVRFANDLLF